MGITVAFTRDLAKHAPLGLYCLMRVIAAGDRASLQKANAWAGQWYLHNFFVLLWFSVQLCKHKNMGTSPCGLHKSILHIKRRVQHRTSFCPCFPFPNGSPVSPFFLHSCFSYVVFFLLFFSLISSWRFFPCFLSLFCLLPSSLLPCMPNRLLERAREEGAARQGPKNKQKKETNGSWGAKTRTNGKNEKYSQEMEKQDAR